jgi:glycosyltransferase involved in cell wall biosynthesis
VMNILFTCGSLKLGGVQKSIISLLKNLDSSKYEVTLLLDDLNGELLSEVPDNVKIVKASGDFYRAHKFLHDKKESFILLLKHPMIIICIIKYLIECKFKYNRKVLLQQIWKVIGDRIDTSKYGKEYDAIITYAGGMGLWDYLCIYKMHAKKKICWIHGNYTVFGTKTEYEKKCLTEYDHIVFVSEECKNIFIKEVPFCRSELHVLKNIIYEEEITNRSYDYVESIKENRNTFRFVSVARLDKGKGFDLGIKAAAMLEKENISFRWDIIGMGPEYSSLAAMIKKEGLDNRVFLLGSISNPLPYVKHANAFIHLSHSEGMSMSVEEAKILKKAILVTNYPTVNDQIKHNETGYIVDINAKSIYTGMKLFIENPSYVQKLEGNLSNYHYVTNTIKQLQEILE